MHTYQDLLEVIESGKDTAKFIYEAILKHESSDDFKFAKEANEYYKQKNTTIRNYERILFEVTGKAVRDDFSPNYKLASNFFYRFITQENQYLLGNGVTFDVKTVKNKLGTPRYDFDKQLQKAGKYALTEKVSFGFWNLDHIDVFKFTEFVPLFDEETGALRAGIRYWQLDKDKPLRATLYEEDGYTEYKWDDKTLVDTSEVIKNKTAYVINGTYNDADGFEITDGRNYPSFPIVPLWANDSHQSSLVGIREQIDCYDLIKGGFANTVDEASIIYWTLQNAGGMDEVDLREFVERIRKLHAATVDDELKAVKATPIPIKYCPLMIKLLREVGGDLADNLIQSLHTQDEKMQTEMMCQLINQIVINGGYFDTNRPLNSCEANVVFGASETMSSAFKTQMIDAAVIVSNNLGTIITTNDLNTQGAVKRMTGLFHTSPNETIVNTALNEGIIPIFPYTATIDQLEGVEKAISLGYKKIAVSVAAYDNWLHEKLFALEKQYNVTIYKFGLCSTGIDKETAEKMQKYADVIWSCASKYVKEFVEPNAIAQVGIKIPVHIMTQQGWEIVKNHLSLISNKNNLEDVLLQNGEEKPVILNSNGEIKLTRKKNIYSCADCPHPCI